MIFEALQSELVRYDFHLLSSELQKISEFNLTTEGIITAPSWTLDMTKWWTQSPNWDKLGMQFYREPKVDMSEAGYDVSFWKILENPKDFGIHETVVYGLDYLES